MARIRGFLRVSMTAATAKVIENYVVDRTFEDHAKKCDPDDLGCPHVSNLPGSRLVAAGLKIGKKRATLDLPCPYSYEDPYAQIDVLRGVAIRIKGVGQIQKQQVHEAMLRVYEEIMAYADRNPMVVIAEAALPPSGSKAR